jgi:hypothetical protein
MEKPGASPPGFFSPASDQNGGRDGRDVFVAFSSVVTKNSSRSRSNFSCVALKRATRAAISSRSRAIRSCCSVIPIPCCDLANRVSHISHTFVVAITARLRKAHRFIVMETARHENWRANCVRGG